MKKILLMCLIALGIMLTSCNKPIKEYDFSGSYSVTYESGYLDTPGNLIHQDTLLVIEYINDVEVKTYGYFTTTGIVRDSLIYLESIEITTNTWYGNDLPYNKLDFAPGKLDGNLLYLTVLQETWVWGNGVGNSSGPHLAKIIAFKH